MKKRSVTIDGHRTSISLEDPFWTALESIAKEQNCTLIQIIKHIDEHRSTSLSSAIRVYILTHYQRR